MNLEVGDVVHFKAVYVPEYEEETVRREEKNLAFELWSEGKRTVRRVKTSSGGGGLVAYEPFEYGNVRAESIIGLGDKLIFEYLNDRIVLDGFDFASKEHFPVLSIVVYAEENFDGKWIWQAIATGHLLNEKNMIVCRQRSDDAFSKKRMVHGRLLLRGEFENVCTFDPADRARLLYEKVIVPDCLWSLKNRDVTLPSLRKRVISPPSVRLNGLPTDGFSAAYEIRAGLPPQSFWKREVGVITEEWLINALTAVLKESGKFVSLYDFEKKCVNMFRTGKVNLDLLAIPSKVASLHCATRPFVEDRRVVWTNGKRKIIRTDDYQTGFQIQGDCEDGMAVVYYVLRDLSVRNDWKSAEARCLRALTLICGVPVAISGTACNPLSPRVVDTHFFGATVPWCPFMSKKRGWSLRKTSGSLARLLADVLTGIIGSVHPDLFSKVPVGRLESTLIADPYRRPVSREKRVALAKIDAWIERVIGDCSVRWSKYTREFHDETIARDCYRGFTDVDDILFAGGNDAWFVFRGKNGALGVPFDDIDECSFVRPSANAWNDPEILAAEKSLMRLWRPAVPLPGIAIARARLTDEGGETERRVTVFCGDKVDLIEKMKRVAYVLKAKSWSRFQYGFAIAAVFEL